MGDDLETELDTPVFDRRDELPNLSIDEPAWQPPPTRVQVRGVRVAFPGDPPLRSADQFIEHGRAWYSSTLTPEAQNDNSDWPLGKLLRTEKNDAMLSVAERYRRLEQSATREIELNGQAYDGGELFLSQRSDFKGPTGELRLKGVRQVKKQQQPSQIRRNASPVPTRWNGDRTIIDKIDSEPVLARLRHALGPVVADFEAAVLDGATLEDIGRLHGVGNATGAKGAGRVLVFLGFTIVDQEWQAIELEMQRPARPAA